METGKFSFSGKTLSPFQLLDSYQKQPWINATPVLVIKPAANQADINRFVGENLIQFVLNQKPINDSTWNAFISGLDGVGVKDWKLTPGKPSKPAAS